MKRTLIIGVACAISLTAQEQQEKKEFKFIQREDVFTQAIPAQGVHFMSSEMSWEEKIVKGQPYSADAVTETGQTLADGNRISRKQTSQVYRDGEGRTRREQSMNAVGPWSSGQDFRTVFINDPVARVNWILDPQNKTARKILLPPGGAGEPHIEIIEGKVQGAMVAGVAGVRAQSPEQHFEIAIEGPGPGQPAVARTHQASGTATFKNAALGKQMVEGVECEGTRSTSTIPAGEIGNERPIEIVSEKWVSTELGVTVMSKRSDPRAGETTYRLTNIRRGEPGAHLFEPSSEYTVDSGDKMIMRRRAKPQE